MTLLTVLPRLRTNNLKGLGATLTVGTIEVAIDGATVRIGAGAPADTIAAVLRALKAGA
jgi:hypothetical protein